MSCYVIVLNYNGWRDTIECLDSLLQSEYDDFKIIVCDNNSQNDSLIKIKNWLDGNQPSDCTIKNDLFNSHITQYLNYTYWDVPKIACFESKLLLVQNNKNKGFASGNNLGIKIALKHNDCDYLFILNNDTVVAKKTISLAIRYLNNNSDVGIVSTKVMDYYNPQNPAWKIYKYVPIYGKEILTEEISNNKDVITKYTGCAFFVSRDFINHVGLMDEDYFMYFEELDWIKKNNCKYKHSIIENAFVFHKEGSSLSTQSYFAKFCYMRSLFLFQKKYYPNYLFSIYIYWWIKGLKNLLTGQLKYSSMIIKFLIYFPVYKEKYHGGFSELN